MAAKIGLGGGIGSGKSTVCEMLRQHGVFTISADEIAHQLMAPGTAQHRAIVRAFGHAVLDDHGAINRQTLGTRVFANTDEKATLEAILHPPIRARMQELAEDCAAPYCILEIPLLIETGQYRTMDRVVVIACPAETRVQRLVAARGMGETAARRVLQNQLTDDQRIRHADDVIDNNGTLPDLEQQVTRLHERWTRLFSAPQPTPH